MWNRKGIKRLLTRRNKKKSVEVLWGLPVKTCTGQHALKDAAKSSIPLRIPERNKIVSDVSEKFFSAENVRLEVEQLVESAKELRDQLVSCLNRLSEVSLSQRNDDSASSRCLELDEKVMAIKDLVKHFVVSCQNQAAGKVPYGDFKKTIVKCAPWMKDDLGKLDSSADYSVAPTNKPENERCKVGRPKGKILRKNATDDIQNKLCYKHRSKKNFEDMRDKYKEEGGVRVGWEPWACPPPLDD